MAEFDSIEIVDGLTESTNRVSLKAVFSQFGMVEVCWVPPPHLRQQEHAFVRYGSKEIAAQALEACQNGIVYLDGLMLRAQMRMQNGGGKSGKGGGRGGGGGRRPRSRSSSSTPPRQREIARRRRAGGNRGRDSRSRSRGRRDSRGRGHRPRYGGRGSRVPTW
mmetsp:Transcript_19790/g.48088  ORF Transcript_19790/g.48088 Transcript_19790/m.48088 type:complete len:163 (+) Transcript_19790:61-549(+)